MAGTPHERQLIESFDALLGKHEALLRSKKDCSGKETQPSFTGLSELLEGYETARAEHRQQQVTTADDFNIIQTLDLINDELRHSMLLAWLLDHDITGFGTHAQGSLGFRLFLQEVGLPASYAQLPYSVFREVSGESSRVDIRIEAKGKFIIDIENKLWSEEGLDQTDREWWDLCRRAKDQTTVRAPVLHAFFLSPEGRKPLNSNFHRISWNQIARVVEKFTSQAQAPQVKLFAEHYAGTLRKFVAGHQSIRTTQNEEIDV